jgi:hypothetical protein
MHIPEFNLYSPDEHSMEHGAQAQAHAQVLPFSFRYQLSEIGVSISPTSQQARCQIFRTYRNSYFTQLNAFSL